MIDRIQRRLRRWRAPGARGERIAARWLRRRGFRIRRRNRRLGRLEADLIVEDPAGHMRIVEVKTRVGGGPPPESNLTFVKQRHLRVLAHRVARESGRVVHVDAVTVRLRGREAEVKYYRDILP